MNPEKMYGLVFGMMKEYDRLAGKEGRAEAVAHNPEAFKDDGLEFFRSAAKAIQLINEDLDRRAVGGRPLDGMKEFLKAGPKKGDSTPAYVYYERLHYYYHGYGILVLQNKMQSIQLPEADTVPDWVQKEIGLCWRDQADGKLQEVKLPTFADIKRAKAEQEPWKRGGYAVTIDLGDGLLMKAELLEGAMKAIGACAGFYNFADRRICMHLYGKTGDACLACVRPNASYKGAKA